MTESEEAVGSAVTAADSNTSGRLTEIYAELASIEADEAPARAAVILAGLGFSPAAQGRPTREVSMISSPLYHSFDSSDFILQIIDCLYIYLLFI